MDMKVLEVTWYTNVTTIGIILAENTVGEKHIYVGHAPGNDETLDIQYVIDHGTKTKFDQFMKPMLNHMELQIDKFIEFVEEKGYNPMKKNSKHRPGEGYSPPPYTSADWKTLKEEFTKDKKT